MENSTLYASNYTYAFEKARIEGYGDEDILEQAQKQGFQIPYNLEYQMTYMMKVPNECHSNLRIKILVKS